jgi:MOSC domain-containing protein YiiM
MRDQTVGTVRSIALRTAVRGPMKEVAAARAAADGGLEGDVATSPRRGITFLATGQWSDVTRELGAELPWHTRRANVLVDAPKLGHLIGKTVRVGEVEVGVLAETKPCELMDALHQGLRSALAPDCRGGVHGRVLRGGRFQVGDVVVVAD